MSAILGFISSMINSLLPWPKNDGPEPPMVTNTGNNNNITVNTRNDCGDITSKYRQQF